MKKAGAPSAPATAAAKLAAGKSKASKSGAKGESIVERYHRHAAAAGIATLHKVPPPTRRVPQGGRWTLVYVKPKAGAPIDHITTDYAGYRHDDGRHIAIEAKTCTSRSRFYLSEVEPHQREYLDGVVAGNGIAALAVVYGADEPRVCLLSWERARTLAVVTGEELVQSALTPEEYANRLYVWGANTFGSAMAKAA